MPEHRPLIQGSDIDRQAPWEDHREAKRASGDKDWQPWALLWFVAICVPGLFGLGLIAAAIL